MNLRIRPALRALGRRVVDHLARERSWFWAYGGWYPYLGPVAIPMITADRTPAPSTRR